MEAALRQVRAGGGACGAGAASGGRAPAAGADLRGAGQVLAEDGRVVVRRLLQLEQGQRGERQGRRRAFVQGLAVNVQ